MKYMGKIGIFLIIIGTIMTMFVGFINPYLLFVAMIILFIGIGMIMFWSTSNFKWKCTKCDNEFKISLKQNVLGLNMGVNDKMLYCPYCKEKQECKGIKLK